MRIMWFQVEMLKQRNFLLVVTWNEKKKIQVFTKIIMYHTFICQSENQRILKIMAHSFVVH
jgi:hypothetical protein